MAESRGHRPIRPGLLGLGLGILAGLLLILALDRFTHTPLPGPLLTLSSAERSLAARKAWPDSDAQDWTAVDLPDSAPFRREPPLQHAWYRLHFTLPDSASDLKAVMFQRPQAALKIWVNGALMADSGVLRTPVPEYRSELRYNLSRGLLVDGENELLVLSVARSRPAGLKRVWIGDSRELAAYKRERNRIEKAWPRYLVQLIAILSVILLAFQAARPRDTAFGWFAASLGMWAAHTWFGLRSLPLFDSVIASRPTVLATLIWFVTFGLLFTHRFVGHRDTRAEHLALAFAATGTLSAYLLAAFGGHAHYHAVSLYLLVPGVLVVGTVIAWRLLRAAMTAPRGSDVRWLVVLAAALLVIGVRDWTVDAGWLGDWQSTSYLPYAAPLVFVVFGGLLVRRHAEALGAAERLNADLERKVSEKTTEIATAWRRLTDVEREHARMEERERWVRDMHDGVGGQLVQALALAERTRSNEEVQELLRACLDELRLVFDAGSPVPQSLGASLGHMRERLQRRLRAMGIQLDWDFLAMPELPDPGAERTLHVLRAVQELVANALKHSGARRIGVRCRRIHAGNMDDIVIEISDDGVGFDPADRGGGRGLANLERRAHALRGTLAWESTPGAGTCARLSFPSQ